MDKLIVDLVKLEEIKRITKQGALNIYKTLNAVGQRSNVQIQDKIALNTKVTAYYGNIRKELIALQEAATNLANYMTNAHALFTESLGVLGKFNFKGANNLDANQQKAYTVVPGDSLWGIANKYGISVADLKTNNNLTSDLIHPGDVLTIIKDDIVAIQPNADFEKPISNITPEVIIPDKGQLLNPKYNEPLPKNPYFKFGPEPNPQPGNKPKGPWYNQPPNNPKPDEDKNANEYQGELKYDEPYHTAEPHLTASGGVFYYEGRRETWYSQEVLPGGGLTELNKNGRHVAKDGTIRDGDGYIAIAADWSIYPKGTFVMTSLGPGKVYDCGSAIKGERIDIYVSEDGGWWEYE